jgi:hypothetical protein
MNEPYGNPRYVREREIFYDDLPPEVGADFDEDEDEDDIESDHHLGGNNQPGVAGACDEPE